MLPFIPSFLERGFLVANVGYRLAGEAPAPAAAADIRHAIAFIQSQAHRWNGNANDLMLAGFSAGAHLALLAALAPASALPGPQCRARAILSFWAITNLEDLVHGRNARDFARKWLPHLWYSNDLLRQLSPIEYAPKPPLDLCAVHSINDDIVPYSHSASLVEAFQKANCRAQLIRLTQNSHAAPIDQYPALFERIFEFLRPPKWPNP